MTGAEPRCPTCAGSGRDPDAPPEQRKAPCPVCGGTGQPMAGQVGLDVMRATMGPLEELPMPRGTVFG